ncbi:uncharacterized protein LOC121967716 [Zingiber officinale]|uniref:uncharacterized protein LOC121967716 n=1 Tax=Zingiber officinale TaxID=94328 RepID=UPI001C4B5258|nr:uncharacterized protein LOC121967716 [Zingiber officinale]
MRSATQKQDRSLVGELVFLFMRRKSSIMVASKLLIASIAILLLFVGAWADAPTQEEVVEPEDSDSGLRLELEQLKRKIFTLESSNLGKVQELKSKDERITYLENIVKEKSMTIASLQSDIALIQKRGDLDAKEIVKKARARVDELEEQVEKLRTEIKLKNSERDSLDARANEAEMKAKDLSLKLESLQKTNDEQYRRIQKTEHALQVAEEELLRVQLEATAKSKELSQAHGAWFPPWLATHTNYYKELATTHWKEHGEPVLDVLLQKVSEKSIQAQQFMEPHFESSKAKWMFLVSSTEPYVQTVSSKAAEVYHTSKSAMSSHIAKVQEISDPYFQAAKRFSQPYVKQFATITKPHVEKVRVAFSPYSDCVIHAYGKFLESATTYHQQVQVGIQENLKKYELIKFLATKELVWFMASTLLVFPVFLAYKLLSYILSSKKKKTTKSSHATRPQRKPKHRHVEK